jgi:aspartyl-tRNA(Asn)/glutamyl-tRNA(Gln) amidotransferase subunit A
MIRGHEASQVTAGDGTKRLVLPSCAVEAEAAPEIAEAVFEAKAVLQSQGYQVEDAALPDILELHRLAEIVQSVESVEAHRQRLRCRSLYTPHVLRRIEAGYRVSSEAYREALAARPRHIERFIGNCLEGAGALLLPTIGHPVPRIDETDEERVGAIPDLVFNITRWTRWLNYLGVPAVSVPCGFDRNGLPIGLQIIGPRRSEFELLDIAKQFQAVTAWHEMESPLYTERRLAARSDAYQPRLGE